METRGEGFLAFIKVLWITLTVVVLIATLYYYDGKSNSDADVLLALGMLTLSFPISWVVAAASSILGELGSDKFGLLFEVNYSSIFIRWVCLFIAGYWQFIAIPRVFRYKALRKRVSRRSS